jgi:hypothetical protein
LAWSGIISGPVIELNLSTRIAHRGNPQPNARNAHHWKLQTPLKMKFSRFRGGRRA